MKDKIDLIYISLSGNTDSFVKRLRDYLLLNTKIKEVNLLNIISECKITKYNAI